MAVALPVEVVCHSLHAGTYSRAPARGCKITYATGCMLCRRQALNATCCSLDSWSSHGRTPLWSVCSSTCAHARFAWQSRCTLCYQVQQPCMSLPLVEPAGGASASLCEMCSMLSLRRRGLPLTLCCIDAGVLAGFSTHAGPSGRQVCSRVSRCMRARRCRGLLGEDRAAGAAHTFSIETKHDGTLLCCSTGTAHPVLHAGTAVQGCEAAAAEPNTQ